MSKSTETTNDRVPRVLVRFGKHPSSVGNVHRAWGNVHRVWETSIERGETHIERGEHTSSVGKRGGAPRRCLGVPKRSLGVPKRAGLSEREDAGRGGVPLDESLGGVGVK
jgi:hypothetical protein